MGSTLRVEPIGSRFSPRFGPRSAAHQRGSTRLAGPNFVCPASRVNRDPLCAMNTDVDIVATRDLVLQKIGRNVVNYQKMEAMPVSYTHLTLPTTILV